MAYQNLFETLQNVCEFTALENEMIEIINAYKKDKKIHKKEVKKYSQLLKKQQKNK